MATSAFAKVQGKVFRTDHREGFAKKTGQAYSMDMVHVLVPNGGLTELTLPDAIGSEALAALEGKDVDVTVEVFRNEFGFGIKVLRDNLGTLSPKSASPVRAAA
jgi:hypothetical protein